MGLAHINVFGGRGMSLENSRGPDAFARCRPAPR